jgi:hypothetical protein
MGPEEVKRIYKLDLPEEVNLMDSVGHNMIMFVDKAEGKLTSAEFNGVKEVTKHSRTLKDAQNVSFIKSVQIGTLAIVYKNNKIELINMKLETVLHIDYSSLASQDYPGSLELK